MKCVLVLNRDYPVGLIANAAAVLGVSIGRRFEDICGPDLTDADGSTHPGITTLPLHILSGDGPSLRALRRQAAAQPGLYVVDFCDAAQRSPVYDEYRARLADAGDGALEYLGLAICGPTRAVARLTGSIPLLR